MADRIECLRCHTPMEAGYVLDRMYGGWTEEQWSPGKTQPHWWGIAKPMTALPVTTMRCPKMRRPRILRAAGLTARIVSQENGL